MPSSPTIDLCCDLIRLPSVTPNDAGCQDLMIARLEAVGFKVTRLRYGDVDNFWATHGDSGQILAFAGHTDVVPTGDLSKWDSAPFEPTVIDNMLYGRGAADMKGSLAAMVVAAEQFVTEHPKHKNRLAFLITSDEEGIAVDGTVRVVEHLESTKEKIQWCVVGEPSSSKVLGDVIKNGRRGSLNLTLSVKGTQGHVAYPQLANNPIHAFAPALTDLTTQVWDNGNAYFPATSFQISNIQAGTGATNVIPGTLQVVANFRFSTESTADSLKQRLGDILDAHQIEYAIDWQLSGLPFLTEPGELVDASVQAIQSVAGISAELSTSGGTSDGRFIAPTGAQVLELGPINATIHKANECVAIDDLEKLTNIYHHIMRALL